MSFVLHLILRGDTWVDWVHTPYHGQVPFYSHNHKFNCIQGWKTGRTLQYPFFYTYILLKCPYPLLTHHPSLYQGIFHTYACPHGYVYKPNLMDQLIRYIYHDHTRLITAPSPPINSEILIYFYEKNSLILYE